MDVDSGSNPSAEASGAAKALVKGLGVLDLLAAHEAGLRLADIVRLSGVPKGTALRLLEALAMADAVSMDDAGVYRLGGRCAVWGSAFLNSIDVRRVAGEMLTELAEASGETCHLGIYEAGSVLYLDKVDSAHSIRMVSRIGGTNPLHSTALGKAMLAFFPDEEVHRIATSALKARTENTLTDADGLLRDLALVRRRGYSIDDVENEEGVRCVGAPIFDHEGRVVASISVAGPAYRMTRERIQVLGPQVREAADRISRRLGQSQVQRAGRARPANRSRPEGVFR